jgi:multisubunit Na+/H+ antiporter MnhB subunit
VCYAIGLNTSPENIALQWAGILLGFTGAGAICILAIRFGQEALRSWRQHEVARSGLWLIGGIVLVLVAMWIAFFTFLLYPDNPVWRA